MEKTHLELEQDLVVSSLQFGGLLEGRPEFRQLGMNLQHFQMKPFSTLKANINIFKSPLRID